MRPPAAAPQSKIYPAKDPSRADSFPRPPPAHPLFLRYSPGVLPPHRFFHRPQTTLLRHRLSAKLSPHPDLFHQP
jgi:hypothetical protein